MPQISILHPNARHKSIPESERYSSIVIQRAELTPEILCSEGISPSLFKGKRKTGSEFESSQVIGFDIDGNWTLEEARLAFRDQWHIIATTESHGKIEGQDRFRIMLCLDQPITDPLAFKRAIKAIGEFYNVPYDTNAADAARWLAACKEVYSANLDISKYTKVPEIKQDTVKPKETNSLGLKGKLSKNTMSFLMRSLPVNEWHNNFFKAAADHKEQGYSFDEAIVSLSLASPKSALDEEDLRQLKDVYDNRAGNLPLRYDWPDISNKGTVIKDSFNNQVYALSYILKYSFSYNSRNKTISFQKDNGQPQQLTDSDEAKIGTEIRAIGLSSGSSLAETIRGLADDNKVDPLLDTFKSLKWDGKNHIDELFNTITFNKSMSESNIETYKMYLRRWLIGIAAKLSHPGSQNNVLVLQGGQAAGKSRWLSKLAQLCPDYYGEGSINPENKDHEFRHISNFLWHVAEFETTTSKREVGALKDFFTKEVIHNRRAYGRNVEIGRSICSFCASVNNTDFLHDLTGNRRYLVLPIESLNTEHEIDIMQVFAEAKHAYQSKERYWFDRDEIIDVNNLNDNYVLKEDYVEAVEQRVIPGHNLLSASDILNALGFVSLEKKKSVKSQVMAALYKKGIELKTTRLGRFYSVDIIRPIASPELKLLKIVDNG
jgi:hypothetical protein